MRQTVVSSVRHLTADL